MRTNPVFRCFRREKKKKNNNNKSVENAGAAFVKGANEINEFFEKINKQ